MYDHEIHQLVEQLIKDFVIIPQQKEKAFESLKKCYSNKISISWTVEDIKSVVEDYYEDKFNSSNLADIDDFINLYSKAILSNLFKKHDGNIGINYEVIAYHLYDYIEKYFFELNNRI